MTQKCLLAVDSPFQTLVVDFYGLALPLCTPETLSSLSKLRIFLYNAHLALFLRRMTKLRSHKPTGKYRHFTNFDLGSKSTTVAVCRPDDQQNRCGLGKSVNVRSSTLEEVCHSVRGNGLSKL